MRSVIAGLAISIVFGFLMPATSFSQDSATPTDVGRPTQAEPPAAVLMRVRSIDVREAGIGRRIRIEVDSLREAVNRDKIDPRGFVLYLDGLPLWNVRSEVVNLSRGLLEFHLERADTSHTAWVRLLGRPSSLRKHNVAVGVGYENQPELEPLSAESALVVSLVVLPPFRLAVGFVVLLGLVLLFIILALKSDILRDASPPEPPLGERRPFSISRLQMAVWFFLVVAAFSFLYIVTDNLNTLNEQALILIGIGTGTALGAAIVDSGKRSTREAKLDELRPHRAKLAAQVDALASIPGLAQSNNPATSTAALEAASIQVAEKTAQLREIEASITELEQSKSSPVSTSFLLDILTDRGGVSFHRFQMLAWTIILGLIFVYEVWKRLAMPEFSATLLSLMGISAGTYLGFKVPERDQ